MGEQKVKRGRGRPKSKKNVMVAQMKIPSGKSSTGKVKKEKTDLLDSIKQNSSQIIPEEMTTGKEKLTMSLARSGDFSKAKLVRTNSMGNQMMEGKFMLKPQLKKQENSLRQLPVEPPIVKKLEEVAEVVKPNPFTQVYKPEKMGRTKRKPLKIEDELDEISSEPLDIEKPIEKKKRGLERLKLETKKRQPTKPPSNVVSIDQANTPKANLFEFKQPVIPSRFQAMPDGELSFKQKTEKKTSSPKPSSNFVFHDKQNKNMSFSNFSQKGPPQKTASPNQQILDSMRQPINEKRERETATQKTHQGSENESQMKEETEDDEDFPFDEIGF